MSRSFARPIVVVCVICCSIFLFGAPVQADTKRPPNIVLMMADDIGYECLGCYGSKKYRTPNIDRLAAGGMRFVNAHSQPICTPSRVQIMTGIYNNRNYIRFGLLDPQAVTFAQVLREHGYATCIAGKWQLEGGFDAPRQFGFDRYCLWQLTRRPSRYPNPGLEIDGEEVDFKNGEFGPDLVSDYVCNFMEEHQDRPFLVYYPMIAPHWPFVPTPDHKDWDPTMWRDAQGEPGGYHDDKYWAAMVEYTDKMVGKVTSKLDELQLRENTLVIWTGDNGTYTSIVSPLDGRDYRGGKGSTTDNGTHVGFVAHWQGTIEPGKVSEQLVDFSDLFPTLTDVAGATTPSQLQLDGISLVPTFHQQPRHKPYIYSWYHRDGQRGQAKQWVRDSQYKLYADGKFYDVQSDPNEKQNLAHSAMPGELQNRHDQFQKWLAKRVEQTKQFDPIQRAKRQQFKKK